MQSLLKVGRILEISVVPAGALLLAGMVIRWHAAGWRVVGI